MLSTDASVDSPINPRAAPGDSAMWVFVLGDFLIFSSYFIVYAVKRLQTPELFLESQRHLSVGIGALNTVVLLTSSWFIANAAHAARAGDDARALTLLWRCGWAGLVFVAVKLYEWAIKIADGYTFTSSEFFSFYYFFTGIHLIHVLLGLGILGVVARRYRHSSDRGRLMETGATYWHMVDLLWVVILALLYMMR